MTERRLEVIEPVLFLGVFADNLSASFLPQLVTQSAHAAGMPSLAISTVFLLYFLAFSLSVLPAEAFAARRGPKPLIWGGGMLAALGAALLTVSSDFWFVALARVLSGCGQGLLLIGVQSYIFALSSPEKKTHGNSVIVFNFNGGMVSGMAIGSLLVFHMTMSGIFFLSMVILALLGLYAVLALPSLLGAPNRPTPQGANLWRVVSDRGFLSCIVLIGIPSKALLSGVIIFAMPLLLMKLDFRQEDIGQLIMFYAGGVMLANGMILRIVGLDRVTGKILMRGMLLSAAALAMIGVVGWDALIDAHRMPLVSAALVLVGVATLGVAHGFINAPVVTHVTTLPIAATIGPGAVAALYRTVERVGHVSGPVLIGQLLFIGDYDPKMLLLPAAMLLAAAVGFRFSSAGRVRAR
jgi:MFS family permease